MTEPPLLIPVDASPFHLRVRHLWTEMEEARGGGGKRENREEGIGRERERRERTGENLAVSPSPLLLVRSSILRHSRRGLITAYHCCHGNSRSVKNLSALTLIVRLKFHGERVESTLRTIDGTPVTPGYDGGIEYRLEEEIRRRGGRGIYERVFEKYGRIIDHDSDRSCIARNHVCLPVSLLHWTNDRE